MTSKSKVVRISVDVDKELRKKANIGETPDDVLRRILKLPPKPRRGWRK
jgi:negative regulator of replication initiation